MSTPARPSAPPGTLLLAAALVTLEGVLLVVYSGAVLVSLTAERAAMVATSSAFFAIYGAGLVGCAWVLRRARSWARAPAVLAQLIQLGVAWSFRGGGTTVAAVALAVVAVVVLVSLFAPASVAALADDPDTLEAGP